MADNRYNTEYMYGSEAPQRRADVPVRVPRRKNGNVSQERQRQAQDRRIEENRARATRVGGVFTLLIATAIGVMLFTCTNYVSLINAKSTNAGKISTLQAQLEELKIENDQKELSIDTSIDYEYIYNVAVEELGMVYASEDQIINYKSGESEYVMQFKDIPER